MVSTCQAISAQVGELFSCSHMDGYVRIRTPYLYPDGDVIDLFLQEKNGAVTISDFGETLRWLRMQAVSDRRSPKQRQLIADVVMTQNVELLRGMLMTRLRGSDDLAAAVTRLALASVRVADLWFTFRARAVETITDEIADFLSERKVLFDRAEKIPGRSGRIWRPDFHTRMPLRSTLVHVLSTGSRAAAKGITERVVTAWYDLNHLQVGPEALKFVSLIDDTSDVWSEEDLKLVGDLSEVAYWTKPDEFLYQLAA